MSNQTIKLNINETIVVYASQKVRTCLLFPESIIGIKPLYNISHFDFTITDSLIESQGQFKIEVLGNCIFIEKNIKFKGAVMGISLYVLFDNKLQPIRIINKVEESDEAEIYTFEN